MAYHHHRTIYLILGIGVSLLIMPMAMLIRFLMEILIPSIKLLCLYNPVRRNLGVIILKALGLMLGLKLGHLRELLLAGLLFPMLKHHRTQIQVLLVQALQAKWQQIQTVHLKMSHQICCQFLVLLWLPLKIRSKFIQREDNNIQ